MSKHSKDLPLKEVKELLKKLPPNVRIRVYYGSEEEQDVIMKPPRKKNKYTLNQLGNKVDKLTIRVDKLATMVDMLVTAVSDLTKVVNRIDTRLDYIVQINNLKDLPKNN